nr:DNA polymerase zeta [Polyrhizophydium stewartii]
MGDPSRSQFVASIVLVKGIPFYGFHAGYEPFLKIYLFNPNLLSRVAALLQNGAVLGRVMDTYESHIPYLLQFQLDYNLCGMEFIHLAYARFRMPCVAYTQLHLPTSPGGSDVDQPPHDPGDAANRGDPNLTSSQESNRVINAIHPYRFWTDETIRREWQWPQNSGIRRKSYCELELDTWPCEIMNRFAVQERPMHALVNNPDRVFEDNACQLVPSLAAIWDDEQRRRDALGLAPLETTTIHASTYHATYTPWNAESRLRASMENIIEQLKAEQHAASQAERDPLAPEQSSNPLADHAAAFSDWVDDGVPTAFQAVSWLHPPRRYFRVPPSKDETTVDTDEPATPEHAPDTTLPDAEPSDALRPEESTPLRGVVSPAKSTLSHNTSTSVIVRETVELLAGISSQLSSFSSHTPIIDKAAITRALTQQRDAEEEEEEETDQDNEAGLDDIPAENQDEEFSVDEDDPGIDDDADGHGFAAMATDEPQQREAAEEQASAAYSSNAPNVFALHADPEIAHELAEIQMLFPDGLSDVGSQPLSAAASEATGGPRSPLTQRRRRESGDGPGSASLRSLATRHIPQFDGDGDGDDHDADASVVQRTPPDTDEAAAHQRPQDGVPARQRPQLTTPQASKRVRFTADPTPKQDAAFSDHFADSIHGMWSPVAPPHSEHLISTLRLHDLPSVVYQEPFFSVRSDVPARPREIAGREFKLKGDGVEWLPSFDDCISDRSGSAALINLKQLQAEPSRKATMCAQIAPLDIGFSAANTV